jgi:hypothetical protein
LREKSAPASTTNLIWTDQGANPGLHAKTMATKRTSSGTAHVKAKTGLIKFKESVRPAQEAHSFSVKKTNQLMLYRIIMTSGNHAKHMNELCGQKAGILNVKLVVYIITTRLQTVNNYNKISLELVMLIYILITT